MAAAACVGGFLVLLAVVYTTEPGLTADERMEDLGRRTVSGR